MKLSTDVDTVRKIKLARRMHDLGMMPKLINDFVPTTKKLVRTFGPSRPELLFSRGYSRTWTNSLEGFKMSNILFKIYGNISDDPTLAKGLDVNYIATAWEVAVIQYPELIRRQICDISRFTYLLMKIISNEYLVTQCKGKCCSNKFVVHEGCDRHFCWACAENYSSQALNKMGQELDIEESLTCYSVYTPSDQKVEDGFNSSAYLKASKNMFLAANKKPKIVGIQSNITSQSFNQNSEDFKYQSNG